jgi:hypothetical protein
MLKTETNIGCIIDLSNEAKQDSLGIKQGVDLAVQDLRGEGYAGTYSFDSAGDIISSGRWMIQKVK